MSLGQTINASRSRIILEQDEIIFYPDLNQMLSEAQHVTLGFQYPWKDLCLVDPVTIQVGTIKNVKDTHTQTLQTILKVKILLTPRIKFLFLYSST
jgi:hypothetical protein